MSNEIDWNAYLREGDHRRLVATQAMIRSLSDRELALVREAAVMGFVLGTKSTGSPPPMPFPRDAHILQETLLSCTEHSDLYPTIAALEWVDDKPNIGSDTTGRPISTEEDT